MMIAGSKWEIWGEVLNTGDGSVHGGYLKVYIAFYDTNGKMMDEVKLVGIVTSERNQTDVLPKNCTN